MKSFICQKEIYYFARSQKSLNIILQEILISKKFKFFNFLVIVLNTVVLCMDDFKKSKQYKDDLNAWDFVGTMLFLVEITFKIYIRGFRTFFLNHGNRFDAAILFLNLLEIFIKICLGINPITEETVAGPFFKILKVLRLFNIIYAS